MDSNHGGGDQKGQADNYSPHPAESSQADQVGATAQGTESDHEQSAAQKLGKTQSNLSDRIKLSDWLMIILTGIIAIATIANVVVFYRESEGSARDIREFSAKAGDVITSINKSLAEDRTAVGDILKENREALAASERQIDSALTDNTAQGKAVIQSAVSQMRVDQRAWLGPRSIEPILKGNQFGFKFRIENVGKTPARNVLLISHSMGGRSTNGPIDVAAEIAKITGLRHKQPDIFPGTGQNIGGRLIAFTPETIKGITITGSINYFVLGIITYEDVFRRPHCTEFCFQYFTDVSGFSECDATDQHWREHDRACPP